jgi:hypothetical protein
MARHAGDVGPPASRLMPGRLPAGAASPAADPEPVWRLVQIAVFTHGAGVRPVLCGVVYEAVVADGPKGNAWRCHNRRYAGKTYVRDLPAKTGLRFAFLQGNPAVNDRGHLEPPALPGGHSVASALGRARSRRRFLVSSGALIAAAGTGAIVTTLVRSANPAKPDPSSTETDLATYPIRPPAVPLVVRGPYVSTWLPATKLPGTWPTFWTGRPTAMAGIVRVDGTSYIFAGAPSVAPKALNGIRSHPQTLPGFGRTLDQSLLEVTPTRSRFHLEGGGIRLTVEFLSPVEPDNLRAQSIPMSYVLLTVDSLDGKPHDVQIYMDISGDWVDGSALEPISWAPARARSSQGELQVWTVYPSQPQPFTERDQLAAWGTVIWATPRASGLTFQSGPDIAVRGQFVHHGRLTNSNHAGQGSIGNERPVFAFSINLGQLTSTPITMPLFLGQARTPAIRYLGRNLQPLWTRYFRSWREMVSFFWADVSQARHRADTLDRRIVADATAAGGKAYAGLCGIALRQAYGGTELVVGPNGKPWAFLKEISSDGNVSTVDVIYPASPAWLYADPAYLGMLLEPLLAYAETGGWPRPYAEHDLGSGYPNAAGHDNGFEENMPVEESGNMLIMAAAYLQRRPAKAPAFAAAHYQILKQWADYLVSVLPDPGYQNQTDDFAGRIAHSVNLALKGIIAVAAMGQIAAVAGDAADHAHYTAVARQCMSFWLAHANDPTGKHLDLTYSSNDGGNGTWGTLYNAYADRLLGTGLIPRTVQAEQAAWYMRKVKPFGLPLQVPHHYAKTDWEMFTAAWLSRYPIKNDLVQRVYAYANTTPSRVPFSDLHSTVTGKQVKFQARPVQGGMFALLALSQMPSSSQ